MNKILVSLMCAGLMVGISACNSGSSSTPAPKYLTAGTYSSSLTNSVATGVFNGSGDCIDYTSTGADVSINAQGQMCDPDGTNCDAEFVVNLNNDPCASASGSESGVAISEQLKSCKQESGIFTSTSVLNVSCGSGGISIQGSCTQTLTLTPIVQ